MLKNNFSKGLFMDTKNNTGYRNSGDRNSGFFNRDEPKVRMFEKETDIKREDIVFPDYFYFDLTEWVNAEDMTQREKNSVSGWEVTKGYLKVYDYKEAWRIAWDKATQEDREKTLRLPNWNNEIFRDITGIDVEAELNKQDDAIEEAMRLLKEKGYKIVKE